MLNARLKISLISGFHRCSLRLIMVLALFCAFNSFSADPPTFPPVDYKKLLKSNDSMPEMKAETFISARSTLRPVFKWLSKDHSAAHYPGYGNSPALTFFGMKVWESNARFADGLLTSFEISLYSRGDSGQMSQKKFISLLKRAKGIVDEWMGVKASELAKKKLPKNRGIIRRLAWVNGDLITILQWSSQKFRGSKTLKTEYLKCVIAKFDPDNDPRKSIKSHKPAKKMSLKSHLTTNDDGDTYIDGVPMVDQGQKGYCAVAVAERVFRYFGSQVDENDIAQLAGSTAKGGTNAVEMLKMLKRAGTKLRIKLRVFMKPLDGRSIFKEITKLDKFLRKKGCPQVGRIRSFEEYYQKIKNEFDAYKEYRCVKNKSSYKKFRSNIEKYVKLGLPIVWGVQLGLVQEKLNPQAWGGHMRLIIGYNKKTNEIVYTDTWGAKHEFKKMPWDDAWSMTTFYLVFIPR